MFFFNDTATTEIYTLPLRAALPISRRSPPRQGVRRVEEERREDRSCDQKGQVRSVGAAGSSNGLRVQRGRPEKKTHEVTPRRSEEHTSELQSRQYLVCRLLLAKTN